MEFGNLNQKAPLGLVYFVFGCIIIVTALLYVMQKSEAVAEHLVPADKISELLN